MNAGMDVATPPIRESNGPIWGMLFLAFVVALVSTLGALYIGEVLGQTPCQLCWYQRIAMFPLAVILGIACYRDDYSVRFYVIPIALAGLAISLWHTLLYFDVVSESVSPCDGTGSCSGEVILIFAWVPIPVLSLVAFSAILLFSYLANTGRNQQ